MIGDDGNPQEMNAAVALQALQDGTVAANPDLLSTLINIQQQQQVATVSIMVESQNLLFVVRKFHIGTQF